MTQAPPTIKATIAGMLDIGAGVFGIIGGCMLLVLGLGGGAVLDATLPPNLESLSVLPVLLFLPLAALNLVTGALALLGGSAALQRARWPLAVAGAIAALVCFFPLGLPAVIFTVVAEDEFRR